LASVKISWGKFITSLIALIENALLQYQPVLVRNYNIYSAIYL